jgi:DNA-directed RNA polymerase
MVPTLEDELRLEDEYRHMAMTKLKECLTKKEEQGEGSNTVMGKGVINHLYENLASNMQVFVNAQLAPHGGVKPIYVNFLKWLDSVYQDRNELIALLCLSTLSKVVDRITMKGTESMDLSLSSVARFIGIQLLEEGTVQEFVNQADSKTLKGLEGGLKSRNSDFYRRYYAMKLMKDKDWQSTKFDKREYTLLGGKMLDILVASTDFFEIKGAKGDVVDQICPTQKFLDVWRINEDYALLHAHATCPMIIPPCDWVSYDEGGYYGELRPFSRFLRLFAFSDCGIFFKSYMAKLKASDMSEPMKAVNAIQKTPWKIDTKVLEVAKKVMALGGERAGIPRVEPFQGLPKLNNPTEEQLKEHKHKMFLLYKKEASRKGKVLRVLANIKTAEYFKDYERIYFPCNVDFRGRVYPIPSFSFQGDDLNKGLIQFADAPKVTDASSERWFLIAGAEFAGIDKVSFDDEVKWIHENHKNIMDTARDPIGMISWWGNLDCPWEFLQFSFEYAKLQEWKKTHDNSIIGWSTGVPVAFDGTCSGLQHFSAILRDPVGAEAVNLKPSDRPQDIYGRVAEVVNKQLNIDAKDGTIDEWEEAKNRTKYGTKTLAQLWLTFGVNRKVTKRSVMTLAYGSKEFGFRDQVLEDTIRPHLDEGVFTEENANQAAGYMAKLIWTAVRKVVVKAVEGMEWLQKVARLVCKNENVVQWTTPMGLLIQQTYLTTKVKIYKLRFAQTQKRFYVPYTTGDVNDRKQANAIAPNFIHSMDASHLQFTVCTANDHGIDHFAMIHDSYGTTVAQAGQLFSIVRECFVKMYTEHDVLAEFAEEMKPFVNEELPPLPSKGTFDINQVKDSLYAFH